MLSAIMSLGDGGLCLGLFRGDGLLELELPLAELERHDRREEDCEQRDQGRQQGRVVLRVEVIEPCHKMANYGPKRCGELVERHMPSCFSNRFAAAFTGVIEPSSLYATSARFLAHLSPISARKRDRR
jgi:hypothetical protein